VRSCKKKFTFAISSRDEFLYLNNCWRQRRHPVRITPVFQKKSHLHQRLNTHMERMTSKASLLLTWCVLYRNKQVSIQVRLNTKHLTVATFVKCPSFSGDLRFKFMKRQQNQNSYFAQNYFRSQILWRAAKRPGATFHSLCKAKIRHLSNK